MASSSLVALCSAVLCRWVADDAERSGALVHLCVRLQPQFSRLKSNETGEEPEIWWWMAGVASRRSDSCNVGGQTLGFIKGESAALNHGGNILLIHPGPLILPIWCCCCWRWWWCSKRNLRDFPPVKASSLLWSFIQLSRHRWELNICMIVIVSYTKKLWASRHNIPIAEIKLLNQQYGCVCALPSLQKWILSVVGLLNMRTEACRNGEVNDISGREILQ